MVLDLTFLFLIAWPGQGKQKETKNKTKQKKAQQLGKENKIRETVLLSILNTVFYLS